MILFRPKIVQPKDPVVLKKHMNTQHVIDIIRSGRQLVLSDCIQTGLTIVKKLQMKEEGRELSYQERKEKEREFQSIAKNIIICIKKNKVQIQEKTAVPIFLNELFPETGEKFTYLCLIFKISIVLHKDMKMEYFWCFGL